MNGQLKHLIPPELKEILARTPALSRAFLVGGWVRDALLGRPGKDVDIEVYGVSYEELGAALAPWGRTDRVGRSFGVMKLTIPAGVTYDFTIPRRDSKVAPGHKGFEVSLDPEITLQEAAARRDFTINSLMFDPRRDELLDFFGGVEDLSRRTLRHTSEAFIEDPLRVLRGMQFAARFDLSAAPETVALSRAIKSGYGELAVERVRDEWLKWAAKSMVPSRGLNFLVETEWVHHFPELAALIGTPQDPEWHPEGDVFTHTCHCLDALVDLPEWRAADADQRVVYSMAVLAHDFAKPATTHQAMKSDRCRIVSPGHEAAGGPVAEQFLTRIGVPLALRERILPLVTNHLAHLQVITDRSVRRLAKRLEPSTIAELLVVITADQFGRPPKPRIPSEGLQNLRARADQLELQVRAPTPVLMGRHLVELGLKPGREFGLLLEAAFEAQLDGEVSDLSGAWHWLAEQKEVALPGPVLDAIHGRLWNTPPPGDGAG